MDEVVPAYLLGEHIEVGVFLCQVHHLQELEATDLLLLLISLLLEALDLLGHLHFLGARDHQALLSVRGLRLTCVVHQGHAGLHVEWYLHLTYFADIHVDFTIDQDSRGW